LQALGSVLSGTYSKQAFPYRYFDQDADCSGNVTFSNGQFLQFLPNITAKCTSASNYLRINGSAADNTRLFTRGDISRGAKITGGEIKMSNGGTVVLR